METRNRAITGVAEILFGFTGLGRIYLGSYVIGVLKLLLALVAVVLWSVPTALDAEPLSGLSQPITEAQFEWGTYHQRARVYATFLVVALAVVDLTKYASSAVREDPNPLFFSPQGAPYMWSEPTSQAERLASVYMGYAIAFAVPLGLTAWLLGTA